MPGFNSLDRHDRRQGQGHDAGDGYRAGQGEGELAKQRTGQPPLQADGQINRRQGDGHGDDRPDQFACAHQSRFQRRFPLAQMPFDVLHHHDGVVDHQTDREHHRQYGQQVDGKTKGLHQEHGADQRNRYGHNRYQHRAERSQEQEDDYHDNQQRIPEGIEHLVDRVGDVVGGIVGHAGLHAAGQFLLNRLHLGPDQFDDVQRVGVGERPNPHEYGSLSGEMHFGVVVLRPQDHLGYIAQAHDGAVPGRAPPVA